MTSIVTAGRIDKGGQSEYYVLSDDTGIYKPLVWAKKVQSAYKIWKADRVTPEANNGGDMVVSTIHAVDPSIRVKPVHATRGKAIR